MVLQEHKAKYEEQILPQYLKALKEKSYQNIDVAKIRDTIIEQMEESIFGTTQLWSELDNNRNGIMDFLEDDQLKYLFDGLPITMPIKQYFKKIESYFHASERQKEKLMKNLMKSLDYSNQTREVVKLVPVESTKMGQDEVDRFKAHIRALITAYSQDTTKVGKGAILSDIKGLATDEERKVWINSVAMEETGEALLK